MLTDRPTTRFYFLTACIISLSLPRASLADPDLAGAKPSDGTLRLLTFESDEVDAISKLLKGTIKEGKLKDGGERPVLARTGHLDDYLRRLRPTNASNPSSRDIAPFSNRAP